MRRTSILKQFISVAVISAMIVSGGGQVLECTKVSAKVIVKENKSQNYINYGGSGVLQIGKNIKSIAENNTMFNNDLVTFVKVESGNKYFKAVDGVLYSKDMKTLYYYPSQKKDKKFTVPNSVTKVYKNAFKGNEYLEMVNLGKNVKNVGQNAFKGCKLLKKVVWQCKAATISAECFKECELLENITLSDTVTKINSGAFLECGNLKEFNITKSVTNISTSAFCGAVEKFTVDENNDTYTAVDSVLFTKDLTKLVAYPALKSGEYTIPETVTEINDYAFSYSNNITKVTISKNVKTLNMSCFKNCTALKTINLPEELEKITLSSFGGLTSLDEITISENNKDFSIYDNALYSKDYKILYLIPFGKDSLELAQQVESIEYVNKVAAKEADIVTSNSLSEIKISDTNEYFAVTDGVLYDKNITDILLMPGLKKEYTMPATVTKITGLGNGYFSEEGSCVISNNLESINVESDNKNFSSIDGVLYSNDNEKLYVYPQNKTSTYIIPETVTSVDNFAFAGAKNLTKLTISSKCKELHVVMTGCKKLTNVVVQNGVKVFALQSTDTLNVKKLTLGKSVSEIYIEAELNESHTTNVVSPNVNKKSSKVYTGKQAFLGDGDEELVELTFKNMKKYVQFMGYKFTEKK